MEAEEARLKAEKEEQERIDAERALEEARLRNEEEAKIRELEAKLE